MTIPQRPYGSPKRGISAADVDRAADALLRAGDRPTIEKVREKIGSGSPNTINPLLDAWWKRLSARLAVGPAALLRLPESIAHIAESLWLQALDEGRRRAAIEQSSTTRTLTTDKQSLELRSHVLNLREGELDSRLRDREQRQAVLEAQVQELTTLLKKEHATREALTRRIAGLEAQLEDDAKAKRTARVKAKSAASRPKVRSSQPTTRKPRKQRQAKSVRRRPSRQRRR